MIPLFTMEYFGNKDFDKILGYMAGANTAGFALGYPFGNLIFDMFGSYNIAFAIFGATVLAVFIIMQYSYKGARQDRLIIESQTKENEQCPVN